MFSHVTALRSATLILVALVVLGTAACGPSAGSGTPTSGVPSSSTAAPGSGAATNPAVSGTPDQFAGRAAAALPPMQRNDMYKAPPAMTIDPAKTYRATIETGKGNIVIDLYPADAPEHVNNFVFLARQGFFDGLTFHRYEPGFVIQGGDPLGTGTGGPGYNIPPEIKRKHPRGALAMARRGGPAATTPSSGSQFYITLDATPNLDGQYTSFGQVTPESMSVVDQIRKGDVINKVTIQEQ